MQTQIYYTATKHILNIQHYLARVSMDIILTSVSVFLDHLQGHTSKYCNSQDF